MRRLQDHRRKAALPRANIGMILAVSIIVGSTLAGCADASPQPVVASADAAREAACPDSIEAKSAIPQSGQRGNLAPTGASDAILCTYSYVEDSPTFSLLSAKHAKNPTAAVDALNSLPGHDVGTTVCSLMGGPSHRIVLAYADRPSATVVVDYSCTTAHHAGISRRLVSQKILFAPFSD
jgi:hypothetical protein